MCVFRKVYGNVGDKGKPIWYYGVMTDLSKQGWKSVYPRGLKEGERGPGSTVPFSRSQPPALQFLRAKSGEISF